MRLGVLGLGRLVILCLSFCCVWVFSCWFWCLRFINLCLLLLVLIYVVGDTGCLRFVFLFV